METFSARRRGEPGLVDGGAGEPVDHDDEGGFRGGVGENVGALQGLRPEGEDVVEVEDAVLCVSWAGNICTCVSPFFI